MSSGLSMANVNKIKQMAERHEYNLAIDILDSQNLERSLNPQFLRSCAEIYENVGRHKEARQLYVKAHSMAPEGNKIIFSIINFYLKLGYFDLAKRYLEEYESNDVTGGQQLKDAEYIVKKATGAELSTLFDMLYPYYRDNLNEDWSFELFLVSYLMDKKEDYDIISSDYLATFKDGYYSQTIRDILAGNESAETYFYIYSKEEVPDKNADEEDIRAFEKDVLKADYIRHNPELQEAVITEMVDDGAGGSKFFGGKRKNKSADGNDSGIELTEAGENNTETSEETSSESSADDSNSAVEKGLKAFIKRKFGKGEKTDESDDKSSDAKDADKDKAESKETGTADVSENGSESGDDKGSDVVNADSLFGAGEPSGEEVQNVSNEGSADFDSSLVREENEEQGEKAEEEPAVQSGTSKADMKEIKPERDFISYDFDDGFAPESESITDLEEEEEEVFENPFDSISAYKEFERTKNEYRDSYASSDSVIEPEPEEEYEDEYESDYEDESLKSEYDSEENYSGYELPKIETETGYDEEESFEAESEYEEEGSFEAESEYEEEESFEAESDYEQEESFEAESDYEEEKSFEAESEYKQEESYETESDYEQEESFEAEPKYEQEESYAVESEYKEDSYEPSEEDEESSEEDDSNAKSSYETYTDFMTKLNNYKNEYEAEFKSESSYKLDPSFELDTDFEAEESTSETGDEEKITEEERFSDEERLAEEAEFIGEAPAEPEFEPEVEYEAEPETAYGYEPKKEAEEETSSVYETEKETAAESEQEPEVEGEPVAQTSEKEHEKTDMRSWLKSFFGFKGDDKAEEEETAVEDANDSEVEEPAADNEETEETAVEETHVDEKHEDHDHESASESKEEKKTSYKLVNDNPYAGMFAGYKKQSFSSSFRSEPEIEEPVFEAPESKISFNIKNTEPVIKNEEPNEEHFEEPVETRYEEPVEEQVEYRHEAPVEESYEESAEEQVEDHYETPVEEPVEDSFDRSFEESITDTYEEHVEEAVEEKAEEPASDKDTLLPISLDNYDYGISNKSYDFPEFKTDLFPGLMKQEEVIENNFDEVASKQKEELDAKLLEEEKKMREAEELLASLGIKI